MLEHWAQVNSGAVDPTPEVSAKDIKAAQLKSSVGKALKFPAEILGDVYANPYPKRDRRQEARDAIAAREAELMDLSVNIPLEQALGVGRGLLSGVFSLATICFTVAVAKLGPWLYAVAAPAVIGTGRAWQRRP